MNQQRSSSVLSREKKDKRAPVSKHEPFFYLNKVNKTNLIGFGVLAMGVLAIVFVGSMAYKKIFGSDDQIAQSDIDAFKQAGEDQRPANRAVGEQPRQQYKRQSKITEREIRETWETRLLNGRGLLEIGKGRYRFILIPDDKQLRVRFYSNGSYTLKNDIIHLTPDFFRGPPKSQNFEYRLLTQSDMPVMASTHKGKLIWQVPEAEIGFYIPPYHPILDRAKNKIVVWSVLE